MFVEQFFSSLEQKIIQYPYYWNCVTGISFKSAKDEEGTSMTSVAIIIDMDGRNLDCWAFVFSTSFS